MLYPQADELKIFFFSFFCYIIDKTIKHLKCTMWWFDICIYCKITGPIELISISSTSHIYFFFFLVRTFKFYSFTKFSHTINILLSTIVTLYLDPQMLFIFFYITLCQPLPISFTVPSSPPLPQEATFLLCFYVFDFFPPSDSTYK